MGTSPTDAWDAIARRDFSGWRGLPADAGYDQFDSRFDALTDAEAVGLLGRRKVEARYRVHVAEGYPLDLRAWFEGARLVLIDAELPELREPSESAAQLLDDLGEPAATVDFTWDVLTVPDGGHVYPERGITVFVGPEGQVIKLFLYAPTDLEKYLATLHYDSAVEELPLEDDDGNPWL